MRWCFYRRCLVSFAAVNNVVFVLLLLQPLPVVVTAAAAVVVMGVVVVVVVVAVVFYYNQCIAAVLAVRMALNITRYNIIVPTLLHSTPTYILMLCFVTPCHCDVWLDL